MIRDLLGVEKNRRFRRQPWNSAVDRQKRSRSRRDNEGRKGRWRYHPRRRIGRRVWRSTHRNKSWRSRNRGYLGGNGQRQSEERNEKREPYETRSNRERLARRHLGPSHSMEKWTIIPCNSGAFLFGLVSLSSPERGGFFTRFDSWVASSLSSPERLRFLAAFSFFSSSGFAIHVEWPWVCQWTTTNWNVDLKLSREDHLVVLSHVGFGCLDRQSQIDGSYSYINL